MAEFCEILFPECIREGDLEIVTPATFRVPGKVRLVGAYAGRPHPEAPNSKPLLSAVGDKIGYLAIGELLEPPYSWSYWIEE
jgi:hypothetical protein